MTPDEIVAVVEKAEEEKARFEGLSERQKKRRREYATGGQIEKFNKLVSKNFAARILAGHSPGKTTNRAETVAVDLLDGTKTDDKVKLAVWIRLMDMWGGKPGQQKEEARERETPIMEVPPTLTDEQWQARYSPKPDKSEKN